MHLNDYTIMPIITMLFAMGCGAFVISQNPKARLNQIYLAICVCFAAWFSFYIPYNFNVDDHFILTWYRVSLCFISFIPITCFTFISTYLKIPQNERIFKLNATIGGILSILSLTTPYIVVGVWHNPPYPYPKAGALHCLLVAHCCYLATHSIVLCFVALKKKNLTQQQRNHVFYMMCAISTLSLGIVDFYFNYTGGTIEVGVFAVPGYLLITTFACIKYELMDIRVVIRKSLVYTCLISGLALVYFVSIYFAEHVLEKHFNYHSIYVSLFFATMVAAMLIPVKDVLEKYLFRNTLGHTIEENDHLKEELTKVEKYKLQAQLTSSIAHEIKNPLSVLTALTEALKEKYNDPGFVKRYEKIVSEEIDHMNLMVQEYLAFGRPSIPQLERVNSTRTIKNLIGMIEKTLKKSNIRLVENYNVNTEIVVDPNQLKQALLNLILNAIEAMPEGGVLTLKTDQMDHNFVISVTDTGCGIDPKDQEHVFEPFFTRKKDGTGLGLAITHGIIEKHHGRIAVKSRPGVGTTFEIRLDQFSLN